MPVHLAPADFESWIDGYDGYYRFLRERLVGQDYVELTYESLISDTEQALRPVYEMLGQPPLPNPLALEGDLQPQSSGALRDAVVNFEELRAAFATTDRVGDFD